jgi:hypothetical protein
MLKDDELIGAFTLARQEVRPFTDEQIALLGQYSAGNFSLSSDGQGGTIIKDPATGSGGHSESSAL